MAWLPTSYAYTHPDGWNDSVNFPTTPASEAQTRSLLQEQHAEALGFINDIALKLNNVPAARISSGTAQAVTPSLILPFTNEDFDTDNIFDINTDPTKLVCKTAGIYIVSAYVYWGTESATGYRETTIYRNGSAISNSLIILNGAYWATTLSSIYKLNVNDYIQIRAGQNSGVNVTVGTRSLSMVKIA